MTVNSLLINPPRAILFDVFGTVVEWRSTVVQTLSSQAAKSLNDTTRQLADPVRMKATATDWAAFAQQWREAYYAFCLRIACEDCGKERTKAAYKTIDQHHRESLENLLAASELTGLWSNTELDDLSMVWHFLPPYPDVCRGLERLEQVFVTATLGNGNFTLLHDLVHTGSLVFTHVLSSEMFNSFKPNPQVYIGAARGLSLMPSECVLVASHLGDLEAARRCGYRTVYIQRAGEETWSTEDTKKAGEWVDLWVSGDKTSEDSGGVVEIAEILRSKAAGE